MEKYKAADSLILRVMDSVYAVNPDVEFSLRVFGHQHTVAENNCYDTKNEVPFSKDNRTQMAFRLDDIRPLGVTPIAYALEQAAELDLVDEVRNAYSIILITDGGESCGGDICDVMNKLIQKKVYFRPYIVSLENDPALRTTYSCMGDYLQVTHRSDIAPAVSTIVAAFRPVLKISKADYKKLQTIATSVPSILKMNIPVTVTADTTAVVKPVPKPAPAETRILNLVKTFPDVTVPRPVIVADIPALKPIPVAPMPVPAYTPPPPPKEEKHDTLVIAPKPVVHDTVAVAPKPIPAVTPPAHHISITKATERTPAPKLERLAPAALKTPAAAAPLAAKARLVEAPALPPVVTEPVVAPVHTLARLEPAALKSPTVAVPARANARLVAGSGALPPVVTDQVPAPVHTFTKLAPAAIKTVAIGAQPPAKAKLFAGPALLPAVVTGPVVTPMQTLTKLKPARLRTFNVLFIVEDRVFNQRKVPALPPVNYDLLVQKIDSKVPIPRKQPVPPGKKGGYTVETEDAKETSLAIYFTDGMGRFYTTTPQMIVVDPRSNKVIKKFYRTVDPDGQPDPQTNIPDGTYDIAVYGSRSLIIHDVDIVKDKKNKLVIKIKKCSLKFAYRDAPNRPVTEFAAVVTERDKPNGKVVPQKCTEELTYEPGNYHIVINTFPQDTRNVDLDLDDETVIAISQPGFARFSCETGATVASLYLRDGDKFLPFYSLNLQDPISQHLQIQPGEYQAHFHKGPGRSSAATEKVVQFVIKATQETEVILK